MANIGTTVTAIIVALGANIQGKRLAGSHLLINLFTGIFALETLFLYGSTGNTGVEQQLSLNETEINDVIQTVDAK